MRRGWNSGREGRLFQGRTVSKLLSIQVLRAVAALMVAFVHAQHDAATVAARLGQGFAESGLGPWGAGVDIFFVISGFIMVHTSGRLFAAEGGARTFLVRRVARIVPLYWAATTLLLLVALAAPKLLNQEVAGIWPVVASYLFVPYVRADGLVQPVLSLGWTLNYEMFFYLVFAVALLRPRREAVIGATAALAALALAGWALAPLPQPLGFWTDAIVLEFVFGMWLGELRASGLRLGGPARGALALVGVALLVVDATAWGAPRFLAHGVPAALLVAAAALGTERERAATPFGRVAVALGDASYALYLIHPFVIRAGRELALRSGIAEWIGPWGYVYLVTALAALASLAVHRWFERPVTEAARRALEGDAPAGGHAARPAPVGGPSPPAAAGVELGKPST
jgi:peptidoglycan/LPS O-acetylase OafA/YrhL